MGGTGSDRPLPLADRGRVGVKLKKIIGGVHSPNFSTNRLRSSPICRQIGLSLSFISNTTLTSTTGIWQMLAKPNIGGAPYLQPLWLHPWGREYE